MNCGVDIAQVERFKKFFDDEKFLKKYFSAQEIDYISKKQNKVQTLAGLYAAKEAFLKALGIGIGAGLNLLEVNILHTKEGKPEFEITPTIQYYLSKVGSNNASVSISHDGEYAVAFCVLD